MLLEYTFPKLLEPSKTPPALASLQHATGFGIPPPCPSVWSPGDLCPVSRRPLSGHQRGFGIPPQDEELGDAFGVHFSQAPGALQNATGFSIPPACNRLWHPSTMPLCLVTRGRFLLFSFALYCSSLFCLAFFWVCLGCSSELLEST